MRVLVVGSGGREHALAMSLQRSPACEALFTAPGNDAMPGVRLDAAATDVAGIVSACRSLDIGFVVIGPESALEAGLADALIAEGIAVFGPTREGARLEWSKAYTRSLASQLGIPSPRSATFAAGSAEAAVDWTAALGLPVVVKVSGLASGKGVVVPEGDNETRSAIGAVAAAGEFVIEERLYGPEYSLIALCDGSTAVALPLAQDHKRLGEGDSGPNTGGMGAYAPAPAPGMPDADELLATFVQPVLDHLASLGTPYRGALFAGLMLTADGPRLLEYNCRLGDPEAQVLLPLVQDDLLLTLHRCATGSLGDGASLTIRGAALGVVLAAQGYPASPRRGDEISGVESVDASRGTVFHAGTKTVRGDGSASSLVTDQGRVLTIVGTGANLAEARANAYASVGHISFDGMQWRRDIGWRSRGALLTTYASAGVDIDEGTRAVDRMRSAVEATHGPAVLSGVGAFGGALDVSSLKAFDHPVLVASTDGVGTKVELAARTGRYRGVGIDIVHHCINDVLVQGARPLFFLDYVASSSLDSGMVAEIVEGMASACGAAGCALLGGETAEMPGVYAPGAFDIAGTLVGVVDRSRLLPMSPPQPGDVLIGLASNGPHTNGYSLLRRALEWIPLDVVVPPLGISLGDALLIPHRNYLPVLEGVLELGLVRALVHVTGGGLPENTPRVLPEGVRAVYDLGSWPVPPLFQLIEELVSLDRVELYRTLNMGIGMVLVVEPHLVEAARQAIGEPTWVIGHLEDGERGVDLR